MDLKTNGCKYAISQPTTILKLMGVATIVGFAIHWAHGTSATLKTHRLSRDQRAKDQRPNELCAKVHIEYFLWVSVLPRQQTDKGKCSPTWQYAAKNGYAERLRHVVICMVVDNDRMGREVERLDAGNVFNDLTSARRPAAGYQQCMRWHDWLAGCIFAVKQAGGQRNSMTSHIAPMGRCAQGWRRSSWR